ncbi:hypothetical protein FGO68_gene922 [Halteria grandinella]|uniref:GTP-binding protein n=1 Tax=Halteria grandinella TaxID=5974 RepID=A0A8J8SYZ0_HALGN|nr:hypothetical protein FGO68_gene922 [Halteria grandinella]
MVDQQQPEQVYDLLIKAIIIGDATTGKSNLLLRWTQECFTESYISTIGVDFMIKTIQVGNMPVKIQLWDTAGQERFQTITSSYYRGAHVIFLVFDITNRETFDKISPHFITQVNNYGAPGVNMVLVGNKLDLFESRQVQTEEAMALANQLGMQYYEVSSKTAQNLNEMFTQGISQTAAKLLNGGTS